MTLALPVRPANGRNAARNLRPTGAPTTTTPSDVGFNAKPVVDQWAWSKQAVHRPATDVPAVRFTASLATDRARC